MQALDVPRKKAGAELQAFGERFKNAYKAAGVTGTALGLLAKVKQPQVSKLVTGTTGLETWAFVRLVRAAMDVGVRAEYLFQGREPRVGPPTPGVLESLKTIQDEAETQKLEHDIAKLAAKTQAKPKDAQRGRAHR